MTTAARDRLEFGRASDQARDPGRRAELASLLLEAAQPYARAVYGDGPTAAEIISALMSHDSSEFSLDRIELLLDRSDLRGCYVALPGSELPACRRTELLEALRRAGPGGAAFLRARIVSLGALFRPVAAEEFYLSRIAVHPRARGRGLGRSLLEHYLARGRRLGYRRFRLDLASDNVAARQLYEAAGFRVVEQRRSDACGLGYVAMAAER